jgi:hypothetical protein
VKKLSNAELSRCRKLLGNPYAHLEYFELFEDERRLSSAQAQLNYEIRLSRELLQNPYAYLNDSGGYSAESNASQRRGPRLHRPTRAQRRYTDRDIEILVQDLHGRLWRDRELIFEGSPPSDPIALLDPAIALSLMGYEYMLDEELGKYRTNDGEVEVAGLIDRTSSSVHVSNRFPVSVRTFTAAHELAHAVLHQSGTGVHRDRPLDGATISRDRVEFEADRFAIYFLMPAKLVKSRFVGLFGTDCFALDEETAFALQGKSLFEVRAKSRTTRDLARMLANAESFNGRFFISLAEQFHVSTAAMAIRLEELDLVARQ